MIKPPKPEGLKQIHFNYGQVSCYENKITYNEPSPKPKPQTKQFINEKFINDYEKTAISRKSQVFPICQKSNNFHNVETEQILPIKFLKNVEFNKKNEDCDGWPAELDLIQKFGIQNFSKQSQQKKFISVKPQFSQGLSEDMPQNFKNQFSLQGIYKNKVTFKDYPQQIRNATTFSIKQNQENLLQHRDYINAQIKYNKSKSVFSQYAGEKSKIRDLQQVPKSLSLISDTSKDMLSLRPAFSQISELKQTQKENTTHSLRLRQKTNSNSSINNSITTGLNLTKNQEVNYDIDNQEFQNQFNKKLNIQSIYEKVDQQILKQFNSKEILSAVENSRKRFYSYKQ